MTNDIRSALVATALVLNGCGDDTSEDGGLDTGEPATTQSPASTSNPSSTEPTSTVGNPTDDTGGSAASADASGGSSTTGHPTATPAGVCEVDDGLCIFRHETFGDEQLWTDVLGLDELANQLPPSAALGVGLKVDAQAVPADGLASADLEDPATTVALLELDAVVGLQATVTDGVVERIGITCALCHSTVDDSVAPGIGQRLDGWANRDLDPGAIIALTPGVSALAEQLGVDVEGARELLNSWGPGRYDAIFNQDTTSDPVVIPPAFGLQGVALETYVGDGPVSYWNAYVAVTQMGAHGNFRSRALDLDITHDPDLVTPRLDALADYQATLLAPPAPDGSFDVDAAERGADLFGSVGCSDCHSGPSFTDAPTLHTPEETGVDPARAMRSVTGLYRTTPLRGAWSHPPYFHDGSAATLGDVVVHYDTVLELGLSADERDDLAAYLSSL